MFPRRLPPSAFPLCAPFAGGKTTMDQAQFQSRPPAAPQQTQTPEEMLRRKLSLNYLQSK